MRGFRVGPVSCSAKGFANAVNLRNPTGRFWTDPVDVVISERFPRDECNPVQLEFAENLLPD